MGPGALAIIAAILGFVTVAGVGLAFAGGSGSSRTVKRAQAIAERSRGSGPRARASAPDPTQRRKQILKTLREEERRQRKATVSLNARLMQTGLKISLKMFWIVSACLGAGVFLAGMALGQAWFVALALGAAAALGLPRWVVAFLGARRSKKFAEAFPDAADIIVRGIKSGLPLQEGLQIIGREAPEPLSGEFRLMVEGVAHGLALDQALQRMYDRMPVPELRFFAIVLAIQQKAGGNLAEALSNLSQVLRARKLMREKVKALSSEATASAFIIGSLPPAVIVLIEATTPSYLSILFTDPRGKLLLLGGAVWMAIGIFVMRRMINFKF